MTAPQESPLPDHAGTPVPPSLTPLGLATLVTRAIQCQDLRMRGGARGDPGDAAREIAPLRAALNDLQDVMARLLMRAEAVTARPDYERLATDLREMLLATMREDLPPAELADLHRWVTTATIKLAVITTVTG